MTETELHAQLREHADRIRASNTLGRSELMNRLFDFFVDCSLADRTPKEIEIAMDVFGKDAHFEVTQDAMVRVYIHKLRRKLEEYYAGPGRDERWRLSLPRGEYRLLFAEVGDAQPAAEELTETGLELPTPAAAGRQWNSKWALAAGAALVAINAGLWFLFAYQAPAASDASAVRSHPVWAPIVADNQPITIVLGDYYIFGELDSPSAASPESVRRLVREFNVNSRNDLDRLLKERPELSDRYMDLALRYLPISSAFALNSVLPVLTDSGRSPRRVQVILASDLTSGTIRSSHVIYIGLLSGMGVLRDIAFAGSQFKIGDTYDELIDQKHDKIYVSQSSIAIHENTRYRDYGYFSTFEGPDGKRIVILAGTRDVALMHTAEAVGRPQSLQRLGQSAGAQNFEALYAVDAIDHMNLDGELLLTNKLDTQRIWSGNAIAATLLKTGY